MPGNRTRRILHGFCMVFLQHVEQLVFLHGFCNMWNSLFFAWFLHDMWNSLFFA